MDPIFSDTLQLSVLIKNIGSSVSHSSAGGLHSWAFQLYYTLGFHMPTVLLFLGGVK